MKRLILGTAGHIDHGKTALVHALTGVDTDRLKEEKERGITIDLGFAELADERVRLGIVDVPGHEGFIRNMLAGATGMDVVLLVVAADEGVMPQTREHLAIVQLLGVERVVVALTKSDLVEEAWLELVRDEVEELLGGTALAGAPLVSTSVRDGRGLDELGRLLVEVAEGAPSAPEDDLVRLPVDRVFTVRGTGTVVTGTLWSGALRSGQSVWVRPGSTEARIRGLQVHGREVEEARAGERTAVALAGPGVGREAIDRGHLLLDLEAWPATHMLTARAGLLSDSAWTLEHNQRVRVHLGTAEVMARTVVLSSDREIPPGGEGWVQLRLEAPVVARAGDRFVIRSYSPVTTIGGGVVAEPDPPKRKELDRALEVLLASVLDGGPDEAVAAAVELAGWRGALLPTLPVVTGLTPARVEPGVDALRSAGALDVGGRLLAPRLAAEGEERLLEAAGRFHQKEPLRTGLPLDALRERLPREAPPGAADALLARLSGAGRLAVRDDVAALPDFAPELDEEQSAVRDRLVALYREAGLAPPGVDELPEELRRRRDLWPILRILEGEGVLARLEEELFVSAEELGRAAEAVRDELAGRRGLGPTDFRSALPVTRRHLLPILGWMDRAGVTLRGEEGREVP